MATYEAIFTLTAKYPQMKLGFEAGLSNADVFIDNVVLVASDEAPAAALNLPVDFNDTEINYGLFDFEGAVSEIVADPTDASNRVVRTMRSQGSAPFAGTTVGEPSGFATPIPFSPGNTTMSVRVWSPTANTPVRLKVENSNDNTMSVEAQVNTTVAEEWETLVFDFAVQAAGTAPINFGSTYNKATIFFNFNTPGSGDVYFWDDMEFGGEGSATGPATPVGFDVSNSPAAISLAPGEIFLAVGPNNVGQGGVVYRLFYAPVADNVSDPLTATQHTFGTIAGDGGGNGAFGFILGGLQPATEYTFWLYQYNTGTQEYSAPAAVTRRTAGEGNGDDNGNGGDNGGDNGDTNTLELPLTFEDVDRDYGLDDFGGGTTTTLVTDPTDANNRVARTIKDGGEPWSGTTVGHPNGFATAIPFDAANTTMSVRVWSPTADIPVRLKVENSNDPTVSVETEVRTTVAGEWETLIFDFANQAPGTAAINFASRYNMASIFFDFLTVGTGETYYWDDMIFGGEATPSAPGTPIGFVVSNSIGGDPVGSGEVFLAAGPDNATAANVQYRLFYAKTADALEDPLQGTQHTFGTIAGDAEITASLGGSLANGSLKVESLGEFIFAPTPTRNPANVISIFSDVYENVPVDFYNGFYEPFQTTTSNDFEINGDNILAYENFNFVGIEFRQNVPTINATNMTHLTMDVFLPNPVPPGSALRARIVNNVGAGETSAAATIFANAGATRLVSGQWITLVVDIRTMANRSNLGQIVLDSDQGPALQGATIWVDNIYLYNANAPN